MTMLPEVLAVVASFVGTAFAIVRLSLAQSRAMTERFVAFLEASIRRQEEINSGFQSAIDRLATCVRENSAMLQRLAERIPGGSAWPSA